jgi:transposase
MIAKFDDHIPLYRLSGMYDRLGIDISRSVMADWVGRVSALLTPLVLAIREFLLDTQCDPEIIDRVMADEMKRVL